ncbi:FecR domain-containing protein [Mucilaginibacter gynuensis]|uniref:FecR domain-containing protein n=1 Tax=Mucilaginibacter gynuensis TaxID=1302236 RepID=A0ABP8FU24_9SPHI
MKRKDYQELNELFARYLNGTIDEQDKKTVDEWFQLHENGQSEGPLANEEASARIHAELSSRIHEAMHPTPVKRIWPTSVWFKAACGIGVMVLLSVIAYNYLSPASQLNPQSYEVVSTANGQIKKITLADSTEIWLNAATRLRFAQQFNAGKNRIVYLDKGEAFFKVKHDESRPFNVISGSFRTCVLGTSFNIRAYDLQKQYKIAVASGKVSVEKADVQGNYQMLNKGLIRGQVLHYDQETRTLRLAKNDTERMSLWKTNTAIGLDDMTLTEIGEELARSFDLKVKIDHPELDHKRYTLTIAHQNIGSVLQQLTRQTGMSYKLDNNNLTINPASNP